MAFRSWEDISLEATMGRTRRKWEAAETLWGEAHDWGGVGGRAEDHTDPREINQHWIQLIPHLAMKVLQWQHSLNSCCPQEQWQRWHLMQLFCHARNSWQLLTNCWSAAERKSRRSWWERQIACWAAAGAVDPFDDPPFLLREKNIIKKSEESTQTVRVAERLMYVIHCNPVLHSITGNNTFLHRNFLDIPNRAL